MKPIPLACLAAWLGTIPAGAALAQGTLAQRAACTPDVMRLCSDEIPNVDRIVVCLRREKRNLTSACQSVFNALDGQRSATRSVTVEATPASAWCVFPPDSPPGQDVWRAWCAEMRRGN